MSLIRRCAMAVFASLAAASVAGAGETTQISWQDLAPAVDPYDNPFDAMPREQIDDLRTVLRFRQAPEAEGTNGDIKERAKQAEARLATANLDVDDLLRKRNIIIERRRTAAISVNEELLGKPVRLPGYVLPLDMSGRKVVEFLLVPYVGACIHTPPPDPNQLVFVRYPAGFEIDGLFTPVWVTGTLLGQSSTRTVGYSDGRADVTVSYVLEPSFVERY